MASSSSHGRLIAATDASPSKYKRMRTNLCSTTRPEEAYVPFSALRPGADPVIKALVCRSWDATNPFGKYLGTEYILSDDQGSALHCVARSAIAHCVTPKLQVGEVYSLQRITVSPNKETYRVRRDDEYLIQLEGNTIVHQLECGGSGFNHHPFHLTAIEDIAFNGSKHLIDVLGRVINMGASKPTRNGSTYLDFHLINERGRSIKVTLFGALCGDILKRCGSPDALYVIVLPAMNIREYNGDINLNSTSGTIIYDLEDIPEIARLRRLMGNGVPPPRQNQGTLLQLLHLGREKSGLSKAHSITLECSAKIVAIHAKNSWYYYSCGFGSCKKGLTPVDGQLWCEACDKLCEFPLLRYRLHLEVADETHSLVVTVFDELAEAMVGKKASAIMEGLGEDVDEADVPEEVLRLIGSTHVFELKSHTYYNHGMYESFTATSLINTLKPLKPPHIIDEGMSVEASVLQASQEKESAIVQSPTSGIKQQEKKEIAPDPANDEMKLSLEGKASATVDPPPKPMLRNKRKYEAHANDGINTSSGPTNVIDVPE